MFSISSSSPRRHAPAWAVGLCAALGAGLAGAQAPTPAFTAFAPPAAAAATASAPPLTLAAALALALQRSPQLAAARAETQASLAAREQAGARPNPVLELQLEDQRRATRTSTVTLTQPLELGGKRHARQQAADQAALLAQAQWQAQRAELRADVGAAFHDALIARERVQLAQQALEWAGRASAAAQRRVAAGKVAPVEGSRARVAEASARMELLQAEGEQQAARARLQVLLGLDAPLAAPLAGSAWPLPAAPGAQLLAQQLADAPALVQARLEVQRAQAQVQLERARRTPDVALQLGVKRAAELQRNQWIVGLSVPLPLADANAGAIQEAVHRHTRAQELLRAAQLRLQEEAAGALQRGTVAAAEVQLLREQVLAQAQAALDISTRGFEAGKFSFLDVLDAQRTLQQAQAQYLRALGQAHRAASDLARLLGDGDESAPAPGAAAPAADAWPPSSILSSSSSSASANAAGERP